MKSNEGGGTNAFPPIKFRTEKLFTGHHKDPACPTARNRRNCTRTDAELLQNALDALENRAAKDKTFQPTIWAEINLKDNTLSVTDNGIGFLEDQFKSFLAPNVSFKKQSERGNKGVGATYLAYGFNFLQVATKTPEFSYVGSIKDERE